MHAALKSQDLCYSSAYYYFNASYPSKQVASSANIIDTSVRVMKNTLVSSKSVPRPHQHLGPIQNISTIHL